MKNSKVLLLCLLKYLPFQDFTSLNSKNILITAFCIHKYAPLIYEKLMWKVYIGKNSHRIQLKVHSLEMSKFNDCKYNAWCFITHQVWALGNFSGLPHCSIVNSWGPFEPGSREGHKWVRWSYEQTCKIAAWNIVHFFDFNSAFQPARSFSNPSMPRGERGWGRLF